MEHHRSLGEKVTGHGPSQASSRAEHQAGAPDEEELTQALTAGHQAYEEKFGRVFVIRAAGRSRQEILTELHRRLQLDPETELGIVGVELTDIALSRIPQLFGHLDAHSGFDESDAAR
jgi:2-oxo-4-hydroxy-4-carboxy-5-ureidoimidazoline decarboxylase